MQKHASKSYLLESMPSFEFFFSSLHKKKRENAQCKASVSLDLDGSGCRVDVQSRVSVLNSLRREQGAERDGDEDREKKKRKKKKKKKE